MYCGGREIGVGDPFIKAGEGIVGGGTLIVRYFNRTRIICGKVVEISM